VGSPLNENMRKYVYFVRHGESDSNADGIVRGHAASLSEKGREQAIFVAERIRKIGVDAIVSSPYIRTVDTAKAISEAIQLPIQENELFVERRRPSETIGLNYKTNAEHKTIMQEVFDGYAKETHRYSDEENFTDLRIRANAALDFLASYPKDRICVVTHGIFLRVLLCAAIHGEEFTGKEFQAFMRSAETDNTGVSHFMLEDDNFSSIPKQQWIIKNWNDSTHLG
jgi:2,3-bisphosphoglycerate-dependent phosphoglycerate mutase